MQFQQNASFTGAWDAQIGNMQGNTCAVTRAALCIVHCVQRLSQLVVMHIARVLEYQEKT
jgi:hypothetical protein